MIMLYYVYCKIKKRLGGVRRSLLWGLIFQRKFFKDYTFCKLIYYYFFFNSKLAILNVMYIFSLETEIFKKYTKKSNTYNIDLSYNIRNIAVWLMSQTKIIY